MEENERRYEILEGVKVPDFKTLKEASSDFAESGVEDVEIKPSVHTFDAVAESTADRVNPAEIEKLVALGSEVAESEERASAESKRKMAEIMQRAVTQSASIDDLKKSAIQHANEEKLAEIERREKEEEARIAEEEEKKRVREERRALQRKQLEDAKARAQEAAANKQEEIPEDEEEEEDIPVAEETAADEAPEVEEAPVAEDEAPEDAAPVPSAPAPVEAVVPDVDIDSTGVISSDEETFDDFGEFLDDNKDDN